MKNDKNLHNEAQLDKADKLRQRSYSVPGQKASAPPSRFSRIGGLVAIVISIAIIVLAVAGLIFH